MKKKSTSQSAPVRRSLGEGGLFNLRVLLASIFCLAAILIALVSLYLGASKAEAQPRSGSTAPAANSSNGPDVIRLVGPVVLNTNLRDLPYIPNEGEIEEKRLTIFPFPRPGAREKSATSAFPQVQSLLEKVARPVPNMPPPLLTFDGLSQDGPPPACACLPPDTNGDVGPNHYVQAVNVAFRVFDKSGTPVSPVTTFNSLFVPLVGTPCENQNQGDPFVFYDEVADRWVISDFAFPAFPGNSFWQCIAVSQTPDPVAGPWNLYALQVDPANPTCLGDYPKLDAWNNPQPGGAYHMTVNLFCPSFQGVRVYALDRASMLSGGPANAISFLIPFAAMPDPPFYSLIPAGFRTGDPPPAGRDEFLLAIESPFPGGVVLTKVLGWYFHVDFAVPANSTFGVGPNHLQNADITVNGFVDAFTDTTYQLVPQQGTAIKLDTLGDRVMTPVVYQNRNGTESLWADHTIILNYPNGPIAVRWYQFDVTGGSFPATPVQQQDYTNNNDGSSRWMPSLAVDQNGNMAIGYSTSSPSIFPSIRYAGRLAGDPLNDLGQGEAIMTPGGGAQTHSSGRWGDYTMTTIDPADGISFWHTNEYYPTTASSDWFTKVGKFQFPTAPRIIPSPRPRPTPPPRP